MSQTRTRLIGAAAVGVLSLAVAAVAGWPVQPSHVTATQVSSTVTPPVAASTADTSVASRRPTAPPASKNPRARQVGRLAPAPRETGTAGQQHVAPASDSFVTNLARPSEEPSCQPGRALPAATSTQHLSTGSNDIRELIATDHMAWLSVLDDQAKTFHVESVGAKEQTMAARPEVVLLAADDASSYAVTMQGSPGDLVAIDSGTGSDRWRRTGNELRPKGVSRTTDDQVLAAARAEGVLYVLGTPDPEHSQDSLWLAAVDPQTGSVKWSQTLDGIPFPGWEYVPGLAIAADGPDVVMAVPDPWNAGMRVTRWAPGGSLLAHRLLVVDGYLGLPRIVARDGMTWLSFSDAQEGKDLSTAGYLLRLDRQLRVQASTTDADVWQLSLGTDTLWSNAFNCQYETLRGWDPLTLEPLAPYTLPQADFRYDVRGGQLVLATQATTSIDGTDLYTYDLEHVASP